jgi:hypothetical protein
MQNRLSRLKGGTIQMKKSSPGIKGRRGAKKPVRTAKRAVKTRPMEPAGTDSVAEAVSTLSILVADLRQIANDLRSLMSSREEAEVDTVVVTEMETPSEEKEE